MDFEIHIYDILSFLLDVILAAIAAIAVTWKFVSGYVERAVRDECKDRKLADTRIKERMRDNMRQIYNQMGKLDLMDRRIQEQERVRMSEMNDLRITLQDGLHKIEIQLAKLKGPNNITKGGE